MNDDPFYQMVHVELELGKNFSAGRVNRIIKEAGGTLSYDVYGFKRTDKAPVWQSGSYLYLSLYSDGERVDAQEAADKIVLEYPMATIGSEFISKFADVAEKLASAFEVKALLNGKVCDRDGLIAHCEDIVSRLMSEWGEEPGSESLRIMIEQNYPR